MPWSDILFQEYAKKILKNSLRLGHVHHAYIFWGPPGVGKSLTAKIYAQALNCEKLMDDACGECLNCRLIEDGTHPDVISSLSKGDELLIDQVRKIKKWLSYKSIMGKRKVCLLQDVERLRSEAANALLISLEEPQDTTFIMTRTSLDLFPTILSRCQLIRFTAIPEDEIKKALLSNGICKEEAQLIADLAEGSLGKAKEYIDRKIIKKQEIVAGWLRDIERGGPLDVFEVAKKVSFNEEIPEVLKIILYTLRRSAGYKRLLPIMERILEIEKLIHSHINLELALEVILLEYQSQVQDANAYV